MQVGISRDDARQLHQGSISLSTKDVIHIATALQLDPQDLCRPLGYDEKNEWRFYRASAREVTAVWRRVAEAATAHGMSQHGLGELLGLSQSIISRAIRGERKSPVLNWHHASAIAAALDVEEGADAFLPACIPEQNLRNSE